jgi:hypothetical protein
MKKIYIVFECDKHRSYVSTQIKYLSGDKKEALSAFVRLKRFYFKQDFFLNLGEYVPLKDKITPDSAIERDFKVIKTTELKTK